MSSCGNTEIRDKAKQHSQWVVDHLYSDSVYQSLPVKYFPIDETQDLITEFRNKCPREQLQGGYKNQSYHMRIQGNDEVLFIYEYVCGRENIKIQVGYELMENSFELRGLGIYYAVVR